jgi:hypothetical protein
MNIPAVNTNAIVTCVHQNRARMASAGDIGERVHFGHITLKEGIAEARAAGCVNLLNSLERKLAAKQERIKAGLIVRVRDGQDTVADAIREAEIAGINVAFFRSQLEYAKKAALLTDKEIERRREALRLARVQSFSLVA